MDEAVPEDEQVFDEGPVVRSLARENATLKTWVTGLIEGCDGCRADATAWKDALGLTHES